MQAYSQNAGPKIEEREKVQWLKFQNADVNGLFFIYYKVVLLLICVFKAKHPENNLTTGPLVIFRSCRYVFKNGRPVILGNNFTYKRLLSIVLDFLAGDISFWSVAFLKQ